MGWKQNSEVSLLFNPMLPGIARCRSDYPRLFIHFSKSSNFKLNLGEITPHLFNLPFNCTTIFPERWSSMISNSPM